jgi:hypothetical protein
MRWLGERMRIWRLAALTLLVLAFVGPWAMDRVNVPAEYPCTPPVVRLRGDYCGLPISGAWMLSALASELANRAGPLIRGAATPADLGWAALIVLIGFLALLPIIVALLSLLREQRAQPFRLLAWGITVAWSLWLALSVRVLPPIRVWGIWLYVGVACVSLGSEILAQVGRRRSGKAL